MPPRPATVRTTPLVDLDRAIYQMAPSDFAALCDRLRRDPTIGATRDRVHHDWAFGGMAVRYLLVSAGGEAVVIITGIRPRTAVIRSEPIDRAMRKAAARAAELRHLAQMHRQGPPA